MTQDLTLEVLKQGENTFVTGAPGCGKTYTLNKLIKWLKKEKKRVAVTASTGIAATHIEGRTVHSFTGIGIRDELDKADIRHMKANDNLVRNLQGLEVLIIDEVSMLHRIQFQLVDRVLKEFNNPLLPFGGVQLVVCGDFFQLPPVGKPQEIPKDKFCFMSQSWVQAEMKVCYLDKQYRQTEGNKLNDILNKIRKNEAGDNELDILDKRRGLNPSKDITKLYTHNKDVSNENSKRLAKLKGKQKIFYARTTGAPGLVATLTKNVLAEAETKLKVKAVVMFVKNNINKGYVNGTIGEVESFKHGIPYIRTSDGNLIEAHRETWETHNSDGNVIASYSQIPLRLAWGISIHKCQGMTLDSAVIDLSKAFEMGQGYVALSRLRDLSGLYLSGINETALRVDPLALKADKRFRELSDIAQMESLNINNSFEEYKSIKIKEISKDMPRH